MHYCTEVKIAPPSLVLVLVLQERSYQMSWWQLRVYQEMRAKQIQVLLYLYTLRPFSLSPLNMLLCFRPDLCAYSVTPIYTDWLWNYATQIITASEWCVTVVQPWSMSERWKSIILWTQHGCFWASIYQGL